MPKRPALTGFSCPGCSANFDAEIHVPFVGSCGDSICSVCLNEKKIKNCPDCNLEEAFACNQKNTLALKFLSSATEKQVSDSKKAKLDVGEETNASDEPIPPASDPKNSHFSCSSCQEKFDPEMRAPFVGYCGHLLCAICVNEKDNTTCSVCNTVGAFAVKKKKDLAAELLEVLAKYESLTPAIHKPENRTFLAQIVNQLDPSSFVKFARTCKSMHELCFNSKEIKIPFVIPYMAINSDDTLSFNADEVDVLPSEYTPFNYAWNDRGFLGSVENRKKLRNYPFLVKLDSIYLSFHDSNENSFPEIRSFLDEFGIKTISNIEVENCTDWDDFAQFVKDFKPDYVNIDTEGDDLVDIPDEAATCILQNTIRILSDAYIYDDVILQASVHRMNMFNTYISKDTFVKLLKRFAHSTEHIRWELDCERFEFCHYHIFTTVSVDSFDEGESHEHLPDERPLVLVNEKDHREFHVLRKDGKRLRCIRLNERRIVFSTFGYMWGDKPRD